MPQNLEKRIKTQEQLLFFKRWLKKPTQLGTFAPITERLAKKVARSIYPLDQKVVEVGAGTGRLTRSILKTGLTPENLAVVELDKELLTFLELSISKICHSEKPYIIHGDALHLNSILPTKFKQNVDTIVSAVPLMYLSTKIRSRIINSYLSVLKPEGKIIQITYNFRSPISYLSNIHQYRSHALWFNVPPGFVWSYQLKNGNLKT